jgi:hypothetical protein
MNGSFDAEFEFQESESGADEGIWPMRLLHSRKVE